MIADLGAYIGGLWKSWWMRVALLNGILAVFGRVTPGFNDLPFVPYIAPVFVGSMILLFLYANFVVFRDLRSELASVKETEQRRRSLSLSRLESLINEIIFNLDNLNHDPVMLRDEACQAYEVAPDPPLSPTARNALHRHYNSVRALKAMNQEDLGGTTSEMTRRKELREWMWSSGGTALKELKSLVFQPMRSDKK